MHRMGCQRASSRLLETRRSAAAGRHCNFKRETCSRLLARILTISQPGEGRISALIQGALRRTRSDGNIAAAIWQFCGVAEIVEARTMQRRICAIATTAVGV